MKYCQNCGKRIEDASSFCNHCGAKQGSGIPHIPTPPIPNIPGIPTPNIPGASKPAKRPRKANGLGIVGFILSLIGLVLCCIPYANIVGIFVIALSFLFCLAGFITGLAARWRLGLSIAGIVICIAAFIITMAIAEQLMAAL